MNVLAEIALCSFQVISIGDENQVNFNAIGDIECLMFFPLDSVGDKSDPVQVFQAPTQSQSTPVMQLTEVPSTVTTSTTVKAPIPILKVTDVLTPVLDGPQACTEVDTNVLEVWL